MKTTSLLLSLATFACLAAVQGGMVQEACSTMTCAQCYQQNSGLLGQFKPKCDANGNYAARQCHGAECICVDSSGVQIQNYRAEIGDATNCLCARDKQAYHLIGKGFFCADNGSYEPVQCLGSVCFCVDEKGKMKPGSATVSVGNRNGLSC